MRSGSRPKRHFGSSVQPVPRQFGNGLSSENRFQSSLNCAPLPDLWCSAGAGGTIDRSSTIHSYTSVSAVQPVLPAHVSSVGDLAALLTPSMWVALVEAEDRMWDRQHSTSLSNACQRLAEAVRGLLDVEHCVVLMEKPDDSLRWQLMGWEPRRGSWPGVKPTPSRSPQEFAPNRFDDVVSKTASIAGPDRIEEELFDGYGWKTSLRVPVKDRRGYPMALVVAVSAVTRSFTPPESAVVALLARRVSDRLENRRVQTIRSKLFDEVRNCASLRDVYPRLLEAAIELSRATRGEVMYYDWDEQDLVLGPTKFPPGRPAPSIGTPSLSRKVWDTCDPIIIYDLSKTKPPEYHKNDPDTLSELLLPITHSLPGERVHQLGILNLECTRAENFYPRDQVFISELCQQAIAQAILTARTSELTGIVEHLLNRPTEKRGIADSILRAVRESFGFDCGIIYVPDYRARKLTGYVTLGATPRPHDQRVFEYQLTEKSLATWVFTNRKSIFIPDAEQDRDIISRRGVEGLGIKGSILGLPLMIEEKRDPAGLSQSIVAGVLIVWGNQNPSPIYEDMEALQPFVRLAALVLRADQRDARDRTFWAEVQKVVQQFQTQRDLEANLQAVMRACLASQFDRVRIWQFRYEDRMLPYLCAGMNSEHKAGFYTCVQTVRDHPYTKDLVNTVLRSELGKASNLLARRYPFASPDQIPDPDCDKLGKSRDLQWIEVPLVFARKLYGTLAVDNLSSNRAFDADDFEYVSFFGSLAAQAFAIHEMRGMLNADNMATLYNRVGIEEDEGVVRRCLLRFLTHGEEGLGFPRALFLVGDNIRGEYRFADGVGSVSRSEFEQIAERVRQKSLREVLEEASQIDDTLYARMNGFVMDYSDAEINMLPETDAREIDCELESSLWMADLRHRMGPNLKEILICRVQVNDESNIVIVDRTHQQGRVLTSADREVLGTFAKEAGQILALHHLRREARDLHDAANLGVLTRGLTHELRHPLAVVWQDVFTLNDLLNNALTTTESGVAKCLKRITENSAEMKQIISRLQEIVRPAEASRLTSLTEVINQLDKDNGEHLRAKEIELLATIEPGIPDIPALPGLLQVAINNLVSNAETSLHESDSQHKIIEVRVRPRETHSALFDAVIIEVRDNGPGIAPKVVDRINSPGVALTTRPGRGLGLGLAIVRRIAYLHGGKFRIENRRDAPGATAVLLLPVRNGEEI